MSFSHDAIVIGGGSAGLTAAGGMALFGLRVALIEAGEMGGECLNTGCVPSKALIAAASEWKARGRGNRDDAWGSASRQIHQAIAAIAPHDSEERFERMGVEVIRDRASFTGRRSLQAGTNHLSAPRIVVATGSKPLIPSIESLGEVPYLTNETLFDLDVLPDHLVIVGAGPIGIEMAQAFRRLGSRVTVVGSGRALHRDDADAAALVVAQLRSEGVHFVSGRAERVAGKAGSIILECSDDSTITASHLLIAAGREANVAGLRLEVAGVRTGRNGICVDARRRTSNRAVYAIGDCRDGPRFTHAAGYDGSNVALEIALGIPTRADWSSLPHCTFTDPELAQVGLTEAEARARHGDAIRVVREEFDANDRALTEANSAGFCKLVLKGRKLLGATIVGHGAGELLLPLSLVIGGKASTLGLASAIIAYPTRSEILKSAAFAACEPMIFGPIPKRWARFLAAVRRTTA